MKKSLILSAAIAVVVLAACGKIGENTHFARVEDGRFIVGENTPRYFVGANFWYGAVLGSQGEGGDRERLHRELDFMKSIGIDNLRVLVGSEGPAYHSKVVPVLQPEPGVYNDELLDGLDYFMAQLAQRDMYAVLYLNNAWEWSGGYCQYLEWAGRGKYPIPGVDGWQAYWEYVKQYHAAGSDDECKRLFADHVRFIVGRTNKYTGKAYKDDPAIFSWQIANEPRAFADENKEIFAEWIRETAALIKSIDPNHMVSTGSEGSAGCEKDIELWERIHAYPEIDYANIHAWPLNWQWISKDNMFENAGAARENTESYIARHVALMEKHGKPVVLEEFGFPRDNYLFTPGSPTTLRDEYYSHVFGLLTGNAASRGLFAGCNFWAWGGFGMPSGVNEFWSAGDDYVGDPAQEEQGLNSVFAMDSTIDIIDNATANLDHIVEVSQAAAGNQTPAGVLKLLGEAAAQGKVLFGQQDFPFYGFLWEGAVGRSDVNDVVGDYPAVLGVDLGELELGGEANLDGVLFSDMRAQIIEQHKRGGLVTISWHPRNPLTGDDAWDISNDQTVASVLPGGIRHELFCGWLDAVAGFMLSLKDENGNAIPVIFRPWHEHTGSWFWWGQRLCSRDQYVALWRMTVERLESNGVDNMALAYSPSTVGADTAQGYMERYPGDRWVDILGVDAYHGGGTRNAERFAASLRNVLEIMTALGRNHGKTIAVTEIGAEGLPMADWWTGVLYPALKDYPVSYALVWRNANTTKKDNHFYAPYPGQVSEADFRKFHEMPETIFAKDIKTITQK